uniref:Glycosyltransferase N-terminal domain-containing protein n=1 Tax=Kalanchoe fedtschenkoi TaxID=63787 RepID=A0A7N0TD25_KALFE
MTMGSLEKKIQQKPHAVCIPYPAQGHLNPMLKLAKLLHHSGFYITFVHTIYNQNRLIKTNGPDSLNGLPDFQFEAIPDGLPPTDADATQDVIALCESTANKCLAPFKELLAKLQDKSLASPEEVPPVTSIVADGVMSFAVDAAEESGIPIALLWTTSACGFLGYASYPTLIDRGIIPLKDESYLNNGYLDKTIDGIPGMQDIRLRDFPPFARTTNIDEFIVKYILQEVTRTARADAIIMNTFDDLEHDFLDGLSKIYPKVLPIGPLQHALKQIPKSSPLHTLCSNLWREELECITWLNSQKPKSVIYVNFGSIIVMSPQQMVEFAWGLANSKYSFLWIIRPDLVAGATAVLPPEFVEDTKGRSFLAPEEHYIHPRQSTRTKRDRIPYSPSAQELLERRDQQRERTRNARRR